MQQTDTHGNSLCCKEGGMRGEYFKLLNNAISLNQVSVRNKLDFFIDFTDDHYKLRRKLSISKNRLRSFFF